MVANHKYGMEIHRYAFQRQSSEWKGELGDVLRKSVGKEKRERWQNQKRVEGKGKRWDAQRKKMDQRVRKDEIESER